MTPPKGKNEQIFNRKFQIFGAIYQPLELKIYPNVGLLMPKIMLKHFLNYSETTLNKSRKRFFFDAQNGQNTDVNLAKRGDFWVHFGICELYFCLVGT